MAFFFQHKHYAYNTTQMVIGFLASIVVTYCLAVISQSLLVLREIANMGGELSLLMGLKFVLGDLYGLLTFGYPMPFGLMISIGLLVAFPTAALFRKLIRLPVMLIYPLAGVAAIVTILFIVQINYFHNLTFFAGTRGPLGYTSQLLAGGLGGVVFAWHIQKVFGNRPPKSRSSKNAI